MCMLHHGFPYFLCRHLPSSKSLEPFACRQWECGRALLEKMGTSQAVLSPATAVVGWLAAEFLP